MPTVFGRIPEIVDGRHGAVDVTIRLESPVAGAFASGNTVSGNLQVIICPWDCDVLDHRAHCPAPTIGRSSIVGGRLKRRVVLALGLPLASMSSVGAPGG